MVEKIKVAGVQMAPELGRTDENMEKMAGMMERAAGDGAELVVFPECVISGYCFESLEEARPFAQKIPGEWTDRFASLSQQQHIYLVFGMLESAGRDIYNSAVFVGPDGLIGVYRKVHMPCLGVDRFTRPGDGPFEVFSTPPGKIGLHICFDGSNPEMARVLKLRGAELLILITNWPEGAEISCRFMCQTRAVENHVNYMAVNRIGTERGFRFLGESKIIDFKGNTLAAADRDEEKIIYAELDMAGANQNRIVNIPGKYELDRLSTRRPDLYGDLAN